MSCCQLTVFNGTTVYLLRQVEHFAISYDEEETARAIYSIIGKKLFLDEANKQRITTPEVLLNIDSLYFIGFIPENFRNISNRPFPICILSTLHQLYEY
jgi:hypothetical protein